MANLRRKVTDASTKLADIGTEMANFWMKWADDNSEMADSMKVVAIFTKVTDPALSAFPA